MNFFLQINAHATVRADDFVGADTRASGYITVWVVDANVVGHVADDVAGALDRRRNET